MGIKQIEIKRGISFGSGAGSFDADFPSNVNIVGIQIVHVTGSFSGGSGTTLNANSIISTLRIKERGKIIIDLLSDVDADASPWGIQLIRQSNAFRNAVADAAEIFSIWFPTPRMAGHSLRLEGVFNTFANIANGGTDTAYSGTIDIYAYVADKAPTREIRIRRSIQKFATGTNTGVLPYYVNLPDETIPLAGLLIAIEDNGSASNTAVSRLAVFHGETPIKLDSTIPAIQAESYARFAIAPGTGFIYIPVEKVVRNNELRLMVSKTTAGTSVDLHIMTIQIG